MFRQDVLKAMPTQHIFFVQKSLCESVERLKDYTSPFMFEEGTREGLVDYMDLIYSILDQTQEELDLRGYGCDDVDKSLEPMEELVRDWREKYLASAA